MESIIKMAGRSGRPLKEFMEKLNFTPKNIQTTLGYAGIKEEDKVVENEAAKEDAVLAKEIDTLGDTVGTEAGVKMETVKIDLESKKGKMKRIWIPQVITICTLLWALNPHNPYGYYILLRWVCCGVFAYLAFQALNQDANWRWHKFYYQQMKGKGIGLITVCGDADPNTADPIVYCFKPTADFGKLRWLGTVMASASEKGEIAKNEAAKQQAYELGRKAATP